MKSNIRELKFEVHRAVKNEKTREWEGNEWLLITSFDNLPSLLNLKYGKTTMDRVLIEFASQKEASYIFDNDRGIRYTVAIWRPMPEGVEVVALDDPAELHAAIERAVS